MLPLHCPSNAIVLRPSFPPEAGLPGNQHWLHLVLAHQFLHNWWLIFNLHLNYKHFIKYWYCTELPIVYNSIQICGFQMRLHVTPADFVQKINSMAKNGQYSVHVHTCTSERSFFPAMASWVACLRSFLRASALAAIFYKSQNVFECHRQTGTQKCTCIFSMRINTSLWIFRKPD